MDTRFKRGLLFGGIIGSVVTLFMSSEKGRVFSSEIREELERLYEEVKEKVLELSTLTRESYDKTVDRLVERMSDTGGTVVGMRDRIADELKKRYHEIQAYYLYSKIRSKLRNKTEITRDDFEEAVDELVDEFTEAREVSLVKIRQMKRRLKSMWNDFKLDLEERDEG